MNAIEIHDEFVPMDCAGSLTPTPAVSVGAGAIWLHVYQAVTVERGRYVQGGGCTSVGVAGLVQGGGFGSLSKQFGTAAGNLLEAEIVTADGVVRVVNAKRDPDLFWAVKGGGGGSFGVVTRLTLATHPLPAQIGAIFFSVKASSTEAFLKLITHTLSFYARSLFNPHWGEQIIFGYGGKLKISMTFQGISKADAQAIWQPFLDLLNAAPDEFTMTAPVKILEIPAQSFWDARLLGQVPGRIPGRVRAPRILYGRAMRISAASSCTVTPPAGYRRHCLQTAESARWRERSSQLQSTGTSNCIATRVSPADHRKPSRRRWILRPIRRLRRLSRSQSSQAVTDPDIPVSRVDPSILWTLDKTPRQSTGRQNCYVEPHPVRAAICLNAIFLRAIGTAPFGAKTTTGSRLSKPTTTLRDFSSYTTAWEAITGAQTALLRRDRSRAQAQT